jgi:hypothetical protein
LERATKVVTTTGMTIMWAVTMTVTRVPAAVVAVEMVTTLKTPLLLLPSVLLPLLLLAATALLLDHRRYLSAVRRRNCLQVK